MCDTPKVLQPLHRVKILTPSGGMHIFPRENRILPRKIARKFENNHEIYHFPVWRRKSGHVVRSRGHTCEKNSTGEKKELLDMVAGNTSSNIFKRKKCDFFRRFFRDRSVRHNDSQSVIFAQPFLASNKRYKEEPPKILFHLLSCQRSTAPMPTLCTLVEDLCGSQRGRAPPSGMHFGAISRDFG